MNITAATRAYEAWLATQTPIVRADLRLKHVRMGENPFVFLRGTFYRWAQVWTSAGERVVDAPRVLAVGDVHLENFGTWRDIEGRLIWGINDVDEACLLPYTNDLIRLATSALLAIDEEHLGLSPRQACDAITEGYAASLACGGRPFVLGEQRRWLRDVALTKLRDPVAFWQKTTGGPRAVGPTPWRALRDFWPAPGLETRVVRRVAGVGSLGRPRFVAIARWGGALIAREAKAFVPSAAVWISDTAARVDRVEMLRRAARVPDPWFGISGSWIVRRLAPDCSRIEVADLPRARDEFKLLRAMGWETANIHRGTPRPARIVRHLRTMRQRWLERAADELAHIVRADWREWTRSR